MSFYSRYIFQPLMDRYLDRKEVHALRKELLRDVRGHILEIGLGTGHNLTAYPDHVTEITTMDVEPDTNKRVQKRAKEAGITIHHALITAEDIPFDDNAFDTAVCTFTLCSIPDVQHAIAEMHRVLKPDGQFLFLEHGLQRGAGARFLQNLITPFWKFFCCNCHLNRDVKQLLEKSPFTIKTCEEFDVTSFSILTRHAYQGICIK